MRRAARRTCLTLCAATVALVAPAGLAHGQDAEGDGVLRDWRIDLLSRFEASIYHTRGGGAEIYPNEGAQFAEELQLQLGRRMSPYENVQGEFALLAADSEYRGQRDFDLERANVVWEKGDAAVPFRARAGDYSAFLSYRTVLRTLKGAQLELQPSVGALPEGWQPSLLAFAGSAVPNYGDAGWDDDVFAGLSLGAASDASSIFLNGVYNRRETGAGTSLDQGTFSLGLDHGFEVGSESLSGFGEIALVHGDVARGGGVRTDATDFAGVAELRRDMRGPLGYRLRYEEIREDFAPSGANTARDRRSMEAHASWRFASGLALRGRAQAFRDALETPNSLDTATIGLALGGPTGLAGSTAAFDFFYQGRENKDETIETRTANVRLDLQTPLAAGFTARPGIFFQRLDDRAADREMDTTQLSLGVGRRFQAGRLSGDAELGATWRRRRGGTTDSDEIAPRATFGLEYGIHSLRASYDFLGQDATDPAASDSTSHRGGGRYALTLGNHELAFEVDHQERDSDATATSRGTRGAFVYTYRFDKPAGTPLFARRGRLVAPSDAALAAGLVSGVAPGAAIDTARARAAAAGLGSGFREAGLDVYETQLVPGVDTRQRLAFVHDGRTLERSVVAIEFAAGDANGRARILARVEEWLVRRYGAPTREAPDSDFPIREWDVEGGVVRAGVPELFDRRTRIEIHHTKQTGSLRERRWGLEALR